MQTPINKRNITHIFTHKDLCMHVESVLIYCSNFQTVHHSSVCDSTMMFSCVSEHVSSIMDIFYIGNVCRCEDERR